MRLTKLNGGENVDMGKRLVMVIAVALGMTASVVTGRGVEEALAAEAEPSGAEMCAERFSDGAWTRLHDEAEAGNKRKVRALLKAGHRIDERVDSGEGTVARIVARRMDESVEAIGDTIASGAAAKRAAAERMGRDWCGGH